MLIMRAPRNAPPRQRQQGAGLVEVLVAVLVLSFGMLGLAGLQLSALKNTQSSFERGMAVVETHTIIDAMRADRANAVNGLFNLAIDASTPTGATFADLALASWRTNLSTLLGAAATGAVACNGNVCTVTIRWNDERGTGGNAQQLISTQALL
jgi:type IV pilus assembly protein PilV